MGKRASLVQGVLQTLIARRADYASERALEHVESQLFDVILDMIPSAEVIEPLHSRARIARAVLALLNERMDDPPTIDEMCVAVGTRERTLQLSCLEAFGRPPIVLLTELRLNAVRRALLQPNPKATVTSTAAHYGFNHFGRFAEVYRRKFSELPSATFAKGRMNLG